MRGKNLFIFVCLTALLVSTAAATGWTSFRGDSANSGIAEISADITAFKELAHYGGNYGFYASPVIGDLNNDGSMELVLCDEGGYVRVFDGGNELWSKKITDSENSPGSFVKEQNIGVLETKNSIRATPSLADLDADGYLEIIAATKDGEILSLNYEGDVLWEFSIYDSFISSPVVYDIDSDNVSEVLIGSVLGNVYCLDNKGTLEWEYFANSSIFGTAAAGMLSPDSTPGIVVCGTDGNVSVLSGNGSLEWKYSIGEAVYAAPVLIDRDHDNASEVLIATREGSIIVLNNGGKESEIKTGATIMGSPLFLDVDGDGAEEFVYATYLEIETHGSYYPNDANKIAAIEQKGSVVWEVETGGWPVFASPVAGDFDRDGDFEFLAAISDGRLFMIDNGEIIWNFNKGNGAYATPAIADMDGDGDAEIVEAYFHGWEFYILDAVPKADLVIISAELNPSVPKNGENVSVLVNVSNVGGDDSPAFSLVFYKKRGDSYFEIMGKNISAISSGNCSLVNLSWEAELVDGANEFLLVLDSLDEVDESDERNNEYSLEVPFDVWLSGALPGGQISPGETREFSVIIHNDGNIELSSITAYLYMTVDEEDELLGEQTIDFMSPWSEKRLDFEIRFKGSWYNGTLKVEAPVDSELPESDDENVLVADEMFIRVIDLPVFTGSGSSKSNEQEQNPAVIIVLLLVVVIIIYKKVISKKLAAKKKKRTDEKPKKEEKPSKKSKKKIEEEELHMLAADEVDEKLRKLEESL